MITVIGVGSGKADNLSLAAWNEIKKAKKLILKTEKMPLSHFLKENGIDYETLDFIFDSSADFDELNKKISEYLSSFESCVYAVAGSGTDDTSVECLSDRILLPGPSLCDTAAAFMGCLGSRSDIRAEEVLAGAFVSCRKNTLVYCIDSKYIACDLKCILGEIYGDEHTVKFYIEDFDGTQSQKEIPLYELDSFDFYNHTASVYLPAESLENAYKHNIDDVLEITKILYSPDGCPWDSEQTHESLKRFLIEEAYEVADAIDSREPYALFDELGDVLYQITLHSEIASASGEFNFSDVCDAITNKMIRRHPALFGKDDIPWDEIKKQEKSDVPVICKGLPALLYAEKLLYKAEKAGIKELPVFKNNDEIGEILRLTDSCRKKGISPEEALHTCCERILSLIKDKID